MREDIENDPTDTATKRPNAPPLQKAGHEFIPMDLPDFEPRITLPDDASPVDPISLFTMYYTPEIIDEIVYYTNKHTREPQVPGHKENSRCKL
jgi:hypothetical protein